MVYAIAAVPLILWLLGLVAFSALGGFMNIIMIVALLVVVFRLVSSKRVAP